MVNDITVTVQGNIATDPRCGTTGSGQEWMNMRLGSTPRIFDRTSSKWSDGETQWFSVKAFGHLAGRARDYLQKGMPVLVRGRLTRETWGEDNERSSAVIIADSIAVDLIYKRLATAEPAAAEHQGNSPAPGPNTGGDSEPKLVDHHGFDSFAEPAESSNEPSYAPLGV